MVTYTPANIIRRDSIIQTHKLFIKYLNENIVNNLLHLFDKNTCSEKDPHEKIIKYIEQERLNRNFESKNVSIDSYYYDTEKNNTTLQVMVKKECKDFLHLTIHLVPNSFNPKDGGLIHFFKDAYYNHKAIQRKEKYALINVIIPSNKKYSLEFSVMDGYETPGVNILSPIEIELKQEMDVIITVLNRIFDEDNNVYFIGSRYNKNIVNITNNIQEITINNLSPHLGKNINRVTPTPLNKIRPLHPHVNTVLKNINRMTKHITRKNVGSRMNPKFKNNNITIFNYPYRKNRGIKLNRTTRKKKK